jgi:transcriptional regulator with XRE-family HTH domain
MYGMSDVFGRKLRAFRKLKHLTQTELANKIGVSVSIIGSLERGTREPSKDIIERLTAVLNVHEWELMGEAEAPPDAL